MWEPGRKGNREELQGDLFEHEVRAVCYVRRKQWASWQVRCRKKKHQLGLLGEQGALLLGFCWAVLPWQQAAEEWGQNQGDPRGDKNDLVSFRVSTSSSPTRSPLVLQLKAATFSEELLLRRPLRFSASAFASLALSTFLLGVRWLLPQHRAHQSSFAPKTSSCSDIPVPVNLIVVSVTHSQNLSWPGAVSPLASLSGSSSELLRIL